MADFKILAANASDDGKPLRIISLIVTKAFGRVFHRRFLIRVKC